MATKNSSATGTPTELSALEKQQLFSEQKAKINFGKAEDAIRMLKDATQSYAKTMSTYDKDTLRGYMKNISSNEKNLRKVSRYLYYRSHIYFRLVRFYAGMPDFRIRQVVPKYELGSTPNSKQFLSSYNKNLDLLDQINFHSNSEQIFERCMIDDVCYGLYFVDDTGSFAYFLDPDYCKITGYWTTNCFAFAMDMSYWKGKIRQQELEWLGEPLKSAWDEYQRTNEKWQQINLNEKGYPFCFKFRTDDITTVIPPFISLFTSYINLSDLEDIQSIAAQQQIYKLIYLPMKTISGSKESDDFQVSPNILLQYFQRLLNEALPEYVAGAVVPGDELGVIDFSNNASTDTNNVEDSQTQILNISGGGMVLNTSKITTQAGFQAALKMETEFCLSSMLPQIDGFVNLMLMDRLGNNAATVKHFEVSVYTKDDLAENLLKSCQYSFSNRLAYNTCLGISEKATLTMEYLENTVLQLPQTMNHPLSSSFTTSGEDNGYTTEVGQGAPEKDVDDLTSK